MSQFRQLSKNLFVALSWVAGLTAFPLLAAPPNQAARYRLIFADEFDTLDLGTSIDRSSAQPHKWYEGVWFSHGHAPRERFSIADSALSLVWKRGQPQPDSSISTFTRDNPHYHAWRYGYFEARMKWQPGAGAWPAFWLIPVHAAMNGEAPQEAGEIDIFEGQGTEPHTFFGTLHRWKGSLELDSTSRHNRFPLPPQADFARYHTYGLLWAPGRVTWYFDDIALHSEPTYPIFDRQDYCLILSMQAGSDWKSGDLRAVAGQSSGLGASLAKVISKGTVSSVPKGHKRPGCQPSETLLSWTDQTVPLSPPTVNLKNRWGLWQPAFPRASGY